MSVSSCMCGMEGEGGWGEEGDGGHFVERRNDRPGAAMGTESTTIISEQMTVVALQSR